MKNACGRLNVPEAGDETDFTRTRHRFCMIACFASAAFCGSAHAQGLNDPTRPPQAMDAVGAAADTSGSVLQSVLISEGRRAAIIGGQLVELGQKFGEATLTRVAEGEVTLTQGREMQVLRLFPGVDKRVIVATPAAGATRTTPKKPKTKKQK
jgi:MSHA biogenesis protein MshK